MHDLIFYDKRIDAVGNYLSKRAFHSCTKGLFELRMGPVLKPSEKCLTYV